MTKKELSQLYYLNKEITAEKQRLAELEALATNISSKISGLPHINELSDKTAIAAEIADVKAIIATKIRRSVTEYNKLNRYINSIDDSLIRLILRYRYIDHFSWNVTALKIGNGNSADSIRMIHTRFLKEEKLV
ncbi:MAG: hypothetical protein ACLSWV_02695 [Pygmaiobacter massiliensis]